MTIDADVLIIGAGPIGLINAWGMKQLNPDLKVVVLEKYETYQRSHTLIMQIQQLEAVMKATHSEKNPKLVQLLNQLKQDPHIRTNILQQIFTDLAKECGVKIQTKKEITEDNIRPLLQEEYPNVKFILGADGTHSVTSRALFSKENQVKHEFDYVLQLRFEIEGEVKASKMSKAMFYQ